MTLREECPRSDLSVPYFPAFELNIGKYGPEKLRMPAHLTQKDISVWGLIVSPVGFPNDLSSPFDFQLQASTFDHILY